MKVIVNRQKCRKISVQYRGGVAIVTAPHRASVHQINNMLSNDILCRQSAVSQQVCSLVDNCYDKTAKENSSGNNYAELPIGQMHLTNGVFGSSLSDTLMTAQSVMLGGNVYSVSPCAGTKTAFSGDSLNISSTKYYDGQKRRRAVKLFIKQYADINLRASISKVGCALSYCPDNIRLVYIDGDSWYDQGRMLRNNAIYMDYRVVQLPYTCQDRIICNCYNLLQGLPVIQPDYIDDICREYLFIKNL